MRTADFHYHLPPELIAQEPAPARDQSRLLVLHRSSGMIEHRQFLDLPAFLNPGDLLVLNNSKVIPARLRALKPGTGGQIEILLVEELAPNLWWVMLRPGKRAPAGTVLEIKHPRGVPSVVSAEVIEKSDEGHYRLKFSSPADLKLLLPDLGEMPLPPYIERSASGALPLDQERYQTVYAKPLGSVAAPTAGLHFTPRIFEQLSAQGVHTAEVTLHVGLGTFAPVKAQRLEDHRMHEEIFELPKETAEAINKTKAAGKRVIAAGTTALRALESVALKSAWPIEPAQGRTRLFVYPPFPFKVVDALLTNFHLPESTLLMLVSAFAAPEETRGRELLLRAYQIAIEARYRFFSYGDAMLLL